MISKEKCLQIIETATAHGKRKADAVEVTISGSDIATSRFACNGMTQNQSPEAVMVSVRAIKNRRQARQTSDDFSPAGIRTLVENAIASASRLEEDENLLLLPDKKLAKQLEKTRAVPAASRHDPTTAKLNPDYRAGQIREMIAIAKEHQLQSSGIYASGTWFNAIGNSKGLFAYHRESYAECSVTMEGRNSSGWAKHHSVRASDLSARTLAEEAALNAVRGTDPRELQPGRYKVILPPSAVLDLLCFLWYDFSGTAHVDKISSLTGKVGQQVFGSNISIDDDAYHPLQAGAPFDGEGLARSRVALVENGVVTSLVHSRQSAAKMHAEPTGHAFSQPSAYGEGASNLVVTGGTSTLDEMVRSLDRGVLLSRVWYVRVVDPETVLLTGMTRDGTFYIEGGQIAYPIRNFRFNVSIHELLNNVLALGPAVRAAGEEGAPNVVPAMLVDNFHFTEATKF